MKRFQLTLSKKYLLLFFLYNFINTYSQNWERGFGLGFLNISGTALEKTSSNPPYSIIETEGTLPLLSFHFDIYLPIYSFTNNFTLGANIGVKPEYLFNSTTNKNLPPHGIAIHSPNYLTLRLGAGSNKRNTSKIGLGAGIGYKYSFMMLDIDNDNPDDDGVYKYGAPNCLIEIIFDYGKRSLLNNILLRFESQVISYKKSNYLESYSLKYGYEFSHSSVSIIIFTNSLRLFN